MRGIHKEGEKRGGGGGGEKTRENSKDANLKHFSAKFASMEFQLSFGIFYTAINATEKGLDEEVEP